MRKIKIKQTDNKQSKYVYTVLFQKLENLSEQMYCKNFLPTLPQKSRRITYTLLVLNRP